MWICAVANFWKALGVACHDVAMLLPERNTCWFAGIAAHTSAPHLQLFASKAAREQRRERAVWYSEETVPIATPVK